MRRSNPYLLQNRGGAPIIEPSDKDVIIPAFTDTELIVKGLSDFITNVFGYQKISYGTFTPSDDTSRCTVNHNLGKRPQVLMAYSKEPVGRHYDCYLQSIMIFSGYQNYEDKYDTRYYGGAYAIYNSAGSDCYSLSSQTNSETVFDLSVSYLYNYAGVVTSAEFKKGMTYNWIAIA